MKAFVGILKQDLHRNLPGLKLMDCFITSSLKIKKVKISLAGLLQIQTQEIIAADGYILTRQARN